MIKINLLPLRASKKKETIRQQVSILVICVVGVLVVGLSLYGVLRGRIAATTAEIANSESELSSLKTKIGTMDNIKKLQQEVKKKLDVLNQLRRAKTGPASRLAALSDALPPQLWLTRYAENGNNVAIAGVAMSEELIAIFMKSLQASGAFSNVELVVSEQNETAGVKAKRFELQVQIAQQQP
uniref:Fimbrial assembly family protein n=1 Tax=Geobacter sp. (strain M21) TaxID=443144 RepID=C6E0T0_GEOSM